MYKLDNKNIDKTKLGGIHDMSRVAINAVAMDKQKTGDFLKSVSQVIERTYSPNGGYSLFLEGGRPASSKDGHKSLGMIKVAENTWKDILLRSLKNVATRVALDAGDGTTSATIIVSELYNSLMFTRENMGLTVPAFNNKFNRACKNILETINNDIRKVVTTKEEALAISRIALNNDDDLNKPIADAIDLLLEDGGDISDFKVTMKEVDHINHVNVDYIKGYRIRASILFGSKVTSLNVEDVRVIYMEQKLETTTDLNMIADIIKSATNHNLKVMIIAPWIAPFIKDQLKLIFSQYQQQLGKIPNIYVTEYASSGGLEYRYEQDNTKAYLGCVPMGVMDENLKKRIETLGGATAVDFGYDGDYVTFYNISREHEFLHEDRVNELKDMLPKKTFQEKNIVEMGIRKMNGSVISLEVGAYSPEERQRVADAYEDALISVGYAVREGYVPAMNTSVIKAIEILEAEKDEELAPIYAGIKKAYIEVCVKVLKMASLSEDAIDSVIHQLSTEVETTFDVITNQFCKNIVHSYTAERVIFSTATELVNNLLSCNQLILEDEFEANAYLSQSAQLGISL